VRGHAMYPITKRTMAPVAMASRTGVDSDHAIREPRLIR
jgi:hypothetical protein